LKFVKLKVIYYPLRENIKKFEKVITTQESEILVGKKDISLK